jgi:hypothetical protein
MGVLIVLMVIPGGLAGLGYRWRDLWLRSVARRHDIVVPSLLADVRQDVDIPALDADADDMPAPSTSPSEDVAVTAGDVP